MELFEIISAILTVAAILFGGYLATAKTVIRDFRDFLTELVEALEDDNITKAEWKDIAAAGRKILTNFGSKSSRKSAVDKVKKVNESRQKRNLEK